MANRRLPPDVKRSARVLTSLTPAEEAAAKRMALAAHDTVSDIIRQALLAYPPFVRTLRAVRRAGEA